jgi:phenylpyruvate tautomerase PptA (4-oxalocrotonate tautomerase family)
LGLSPNGHVVVFDQNLDSFFQPLNGSGRFVVLEITLPPIPGLEDKRRLYGDLTRLFKEYGVEPDNTRIVLRQVPDGNWGRGGQPGGAPD